MKAEDLGAVGNTVHTAVSIDVYTQAHTVSVSQNK